MKLEVNNGEVITMMDLRELLGIETAREQLVHQLSAAVTSEFIRVNGDLRLLLRDKISNAVLQVVDLAAALAASLEAGTLIENALDGVPAEKALDQVVSSLERLLSAAKTARATYGTPEAWLTLELGPRDEGVEAEVEETLAVVG